MAPLPRRRAALAAAAILLKVLPSPALGLSPQSGRSPRLAPGQTAAAASAAAPASDVERMAEAERAGRSSHDLRAMNALFVNLPERPDPLPCSLLPPSSSLPPDLPRGCLLRIGPNGAPPDMGFLDGDGMVHCVTLPPDGEGPPLQSSTYVDTEGRRLERARRLEMEEDRRRGEGAGDDDDDDGGGAGAGDPPPTFLGTLGAAPRGLPMLAALVRNGLAFGTLSPQKDTCNTALAVSGGRVLALMEQCPPSELGVGRDGTVRTVACKERLGGAVPVGPINGGSLGAHGRTDPRTGDRVHVSYRSEARPYLRVDTFGEGGGGWKLRHTRGIDLPAPVMVHDLALTERYVVLLDFPLTVRPARFLLDRFPVQYEPENGARIGLVPRDGGGGSGGDHGGEGEPLWFAVESGVVLHAANAYEREEDGCVVLHAFRSVPAGGASYIMDYTPAYLHEWILDPATGGTVVSERCLNPDVMVEFPEVVADRVGRRAGSCYGLVTTSIGGPMAQFKTPESAVLLDGVVRMALEDGEGTGAGDVLGRFDLPAGWHSVSEPTAVARTGGRGGTYVLLIATHVPPEGEDGAGGMDHLALARGEGSKPMRSRLLVLDGDDLGAGPVSTIDLPSHVNYGLHSLFLEWDKMKK